LGQQNFKVVETKTEYLNYLVYIIKHSESLLPHDVACELKLRGPIRLSEIKIHSFCFSYKQYLSTVLIPKQMFLN